MMFHSYKNLLLNNRKWAEEKLTNRPSYFRDLAKGQKPPFLYIGCSDSRLPITQFTKTKPDELFIHRNIANMVSNNDKNVLSVLEFAIEDLEVGHIIVCGHYCCGGVEAAYRGNATGLVEEWVKPIREIYFQNKAEID